MPKVFRNPRVDRPGFTNYLAVVGSECMFDGTTKGIRLAQITDGTSNTIAIVEANADLAVEWTKPQDWEFNRQQPTAGLGSLWPGHWNAAWVDGSIHQVKDRRPADEVGIQFTRAGGERKSLSESAGVEVAIGGQIGMVDGKMGGYGRVGQPQTAHIASRQFPSLEEQKLADLIWSRMGGLELEPLGKEDLMRVKALGYEGGLKNTNSTSSSIQPGDILVGLHVWPTTSLQRVVDILNRDDLAELNPLKFYVIHSVPKDGAMMGSAELEDKLVTGRITVSGNKQSQRDSPATGRYSAPTPAAGSQPSPAAIYRNWSQSAVAKKRRTPPSHQPPTRILIPHRR